MTQTQNPRPQTLPQTPNLRDKIYSLIIEAIKNDAKILNQKYGIVKIRIEDDTTSYDLPSAEFHDTSGNVYDEVDMDHRLPDKDRKIVDGILNAVKLLERIAEDDIVIKDNDIVVEIEFM